MMCRRKGPSCWIVDCIDFALGALAGAAVGIRLGVEWMIQSAWAFIVVVTASCLLGGLIGLVFIRRIVGRQ